MSATAATSPRVERSKAAILAATVALMAEDGVRGLTVDAVAARAGVGKATVYRHWCSRAQLVSDAIETLVVADAPIDTGSLRGDLQASCDRMRRACGAPPMGDILPSLVDAAEHDPELRRLHLQYSDRRREGLRSALERARERGEVRADLDLDLACDVVAGPVFYRRLLRHDPPDESYVERLLDLVEAALR
jgi:AcrR family transcriptional regulator